MGSIFISHSGKNNDKAKLVGDWLVNQGWSDVFLDIDPVHGLAPGQRWQEELRRAGERCAAVVVLVSPEWAASPWCKTEFLVAVQLGKKIFPVFVAKTPFEDLPGELVAHFQLADVSDPSLEKEGFERLFIGLKRAGLDPTHFPWPPENDPTRSPYRGLAALEEADAAVFFGRDAEIVKGLDALRRMREGSRERALAIVGVSGSGKSSFLRAGLLARLERDQPNFLPLPVVRPERAPLTGSHGLFKSIAAVRQRAGLPAAPAPATVEQIVALFAQMRAPIFDELKRHARAGGQDYLAPAPTIVIPIDQAEELFDREGAEASDFLALLSKAVALDGNAIVIATVRSESYSLWQRDERLRELVHAPFDLSPPSPAAFKEVIVGPAKLIKPPFEFKADLVDRLVAELDDADALPLLAATLQRLHDECRNQGACDMAAYERLGGLSGTISRAADAALASALADPTLPDETAKILALARSAFVPWLVSIEFETRTPKRRLARLDEIPADARPIINHFVAHRLLTIDRRRVGDAEADVVDLVHEAVLRQWSVLASWIAQERGALVQLESLRRSTTEWSRNGHREAWLYHQNERLREADELMQRPDFREVLGEASKQYLKACHALQERRFDDERTRLEREKRQVALTRRFQWIAAGLLAAASVFAVFTVFKALDIVRSENRRASVILAQLSQAASGRGAFDEAMRYAISGMYGQDAPFVGYDATEAQAALVRAANASRLGATVRADSEQVIQAAFSNDGERFATAGASGAASIFDARTGGLIRTIDVGDAWVLTVQFAPDDRRILTASENGLVQIWDVETGRETPRLLSALEGLHSAYFSADGSAIATAFGDSVAVWTAQGAPVRTFEVPGETILEAGFSRDGARIVAGSTERRAYVWEINSGRRTVMTGHTGAIVSVAFSLDGARVATASSDRSVRIWDAATGAPIQTANGRPLMLESRDDVFSSVRYSQDDLRLATSSNDGTVRIWDARSGLELSRYFVTDTDANSVAFSPDGQRIVTGDGEGAAKVWAVYQDILYTSGASIFSAVATRSGDHVLAASLDGRAHILDSRTGAEIGATGARAGAVISAAYSPDESMILTAGSDGRAAIWSASDGSLVHFLEGHQRGVLAAAFSPDGQLAATASADGSSRIYRVETGEFLRALEHHRDGVVSVSFSADSRFVLTAGGDNVVRMWDARTFALVRRLEGHLELVNDARYSPDGRTIASVSDDGFMLIWDARETAPPRRIEGHTADVDSVAFSPDGTRLVTASADSTVRIWDLASGQELFRFEDYRTPPRSVVFSADGDAVITTSRDNAIRVRSIAQGRMISNGDYGARGLVGRVCETRLAESLRRMNEAEFATAGQLMIGAPRDVCEERSGWERLWEALRF